MQILFEKIVFDNVSLDGIRGGDLGGLGDGPPKICGGGGPCIRPPNILRSSVVGCVRKYEQSKKSVIKEFFSEIVVVLVRKGSYTTFNIVKNTDNLGKENPKNQVND